MVNWFGLLQKVIIKLAKHEGNHNRYDIATRHGLPFQVTEKQFSTREDAINWIINNQLGRRNLTEQQKMYLRGKRYENEKQRLAGHGTNQYNKVLNGHFDHSAKKEDFPYPNNTTARKIAKEYGVAPSTIQRDAWYAKGVDVLPPETRQKIFSGEEKAAKKELHAIAKMEPKLQKKVVKKINGGATVTEAVTTTDPKIVREENDKRIREKLKFATVCHSRLPRNNLARAKMP